jgi:hypothetical protein
LTVGEIPVTRGQNVAAIIATTTGANAKECRFGNNRPAIDTMERHLTPGSTPIVCEQRTITLQTPSGRKRDVQMWTFQSKK